MAPGAAAEQPPATAPDGEAPVEHKTVKALALLGQKRTLDMFVGNYGQAMPNFEPSHQAKVACKTRDDYGVLQEIKLPEVAAVPKPAPQKGANGVANGRPGAAAQFTALVASVPGAAGGAVPAAMRAGQTAMVTTATGTQEEYMPSAQLARRMASKWPRPEWHAPWRNYRTIAGHLGWVRSLAVDPGNEWFATGSADRTIKVWDLATGQLKVTLTGHIEQVTGLAISDRHPYMFSGSLDKEVKCWDLETNKVIRDYHGHLSGIYSLALHPSLDLLMTGGRDSVCRVWDMRTKVQVFCLSGHNDTVCSILTQGMDPQVITGSHDKTIKMWDLRKNTTMGTLTYHKKSVRAMAMHPKEYAFAAASADAIKKYQLPLGTFLNNALQSQKAIVNCMAINEDGVMATGGDDGSLWFWDWKSSNNFQATESILQPGSLESECGILDMSFDQTGSRLITAECDKSIKMWKEVEDATPETHPVNFRPPRIIKRF